tara:strand:+ start:325 stop:873 length:549 start_codon:yes stop_codon:yes gene_type:complete
MAKSRKHEKNLAKVQSMLDGNYESQIQVGYGKTEKHRSIGDTWTDSEGYEWEQKDGYQVKKGNTPAVGMFHQQCKDCDTNCSTEKRHKHTWVRYKRCYHCQMNFEIDLKTKRIGNSSNKWVFWVRLQNLKNMDAIEQEMVQWLEEKNKIENLEDKPFDMSVANALANSNVDTSMKVNKRLVN